MKLKAELHKERRSDMQEAIESRAFRTWILTEVLERHLHVKNFGPAEFYIQESDFSVGSDPMCEVRLSGVSVSKRRSTQDFMDARDALERIYAETLRPFLRPGERLQLMVTVMLDRVPLDATSTLVEGDAVWIQGE